MYLILGALRRFTLGERHARQGLWDHQFPLAHDPEGKILGEVVFFDERDSKFMNESLSQELSVRRTKRTKAAYSR